jgi:hypothetical protein
MNEPDYQEVLDFCLQVTSNDDTAHTKVLTLRDFYHIPSCPHWNDRDQACDCSHDERVKPLLQLIAVDYDNQPGYQEEWGYWYGQRIPRSG